MNAEDVFDMLQKVMEAVDFANHSYGYEAYDILNQRLKGAIKVDFFQDHNGNAHFVAQWPDKEKPPLSERPV